MSAYSFLEPYALGFQTTIVVIVTYLTLIMGELVLKRIGMGYAERVSMLVAKPMNFLSLVASPFVWLLSKSTALTVRLIGTDATEENKVTEEEIRAIVKEGFDVGEVQEVEQDIVERVFNLGDRNVGSIMTHRSELVWLDLTDSIEQIREKVQENLLTSIRVAVRKFDDIKRRRLSERICSVALTSRIFFVAGDSSGGVYAGKPECV